MGSHGSKKQGGGREPRLGTRLRSARERVGLSREELAAQSGLSFGAIEQIESGRRQNPRGETLVALSRALAVTLDYLAQGAAPPSMLDHGALIYDGEREFFEVAVPYLKRGIEQAEAVLCATTPAKIKLLRSHLGEIARRAEFVEAESWYRTPRSAQSAFRSFTDDRIGEGASWVRILSEPDWHDWSHDELRLWGLCESLTNLTLAPRPVTLLCSYDASSVPPDLAQVVRRTHPRLIEGGDALESDIYEDPARFVLGGE